MLKTLRFQIMIHAPKEDVWHMMLDEKTYRKWTAVFMPGSYYEGSWEKGARIKFLAPDVDGMMAEIAENKPYQFLSIKHLGPIKKGEKTQQEDDELSFAFENYTFEEKNGITQLSVDVDIETADEDMMNKTWLKALAKLKDLCEPHCHDGNHAMKSSLRTGSIIS